MASTDLAADRPPASEAPLPTGHRRSTPTYVRSVEYWAYQYKRIWRGSIATTFLYPILYLAAMGVGLGTLVNHHAHTVQGVKYLDFVAPGLLAATVMQVGANESMYPVMAGIKWIRTYFAMLATPLSVDDVMIGHMLWVAIRLTASSVIYLLVISVFGVTQSLWAILALPAAVLTGMAFSTPLFAYAATTKNDSGFAVIYRFAIVPLFLFSGTFFPVSQLPGWMRPVAYATPLYHGVDLCRSLVLGRVDVASALVDVLYLAALTAVGFALARFAFRRRLIT